MWQLAVLFIGALVGVNFLEKYKKENAGHIRTEVPHSSCGEKTEDAQREMPQDEKGIYADPAVVKLAEACKHGDVSAMRAMAGVLRDRCTPELIKLLDRYEAEPTQEHETAIRKYASAGIWEKGYMMWLARAALYGDADASAQLGKWTFYKEYAYIPYDMMIGKGRSFISFWDSGSLYEIGFIDVPDGHTDCRLFYNAGERFFDLCYVSDYEPPDEDGFGAEWEYDYIYFDEFFRRLPAKPQAVGGNH